MVALGKGLNYYSQMNERLPIERSELEKPVEVFDAIAALRRGAQAQREAYQESVREMDELCKELRGVEVFITGLLYGRSGTAVYRDDPASQVERLHVRIGSARVDTYEGHGSLITQNTPFIDITAWTVVGNELDSDLVCARLGVGEFGVTAEIVESRPVQA
jgi:hypothetical protein